MLSLVAAALAALLLAGCTAARGVSVAPSASAHPASPAPPARDLSILTQAWSGYRSVFIAPDGRVGDPKRGGATTSEGQSYALLRAVWMGDRPTFDAVWGWTAANLQVRGDGLFASLWSGGVQDNNSASDADSDVALALLFGARRFGDAGYHDGEPEQRCEPDADSAGDVDPDGGGDADTDSGGHTNTGVDRAPTPGGHAVADLINGSRPGAVLPPGSPDAQL